MSKAQFFPLRDLNPTQSFPLVTISLIIINVIVFIWEVTGNPESIISKYGFVPAQASILTAFTSMFLHGGWDHIFGNMWYLWIFGDNVEQSFGKAMYLIMYIISGFAATLLHYLFNMGSDIPSIGASGAISGVLGSYIVLFPNVKIQTISGYYSSQLPAFIVIGFWFLIQFIFATTSLLGFAGSNIAFWAHVGGFIFGALSASVLRLAGAKNGKQSL